MVDPWTLAANLLGSAGWAGFALYLLWEAYGPFGFINNPTPDPPEDPIIEADHVQIDGDLVNTLQDNAAAIRSTHESIDNQVQAIQNLEQLTQEMYRDLLSELKALREAADQ